MKKLLVTIMVVVGLTLGVGACALSAEQQKLLKAETNRNVKVKRAWERVRLNLEKSASMFYQRKMIIRNTNVTFTHDKKFAVVEALAIDAKANKPIDTVYVMFREHNGNWVAVGILTRPLGKK
jgi:hypothetical protein